MTVVFFPDNTTTHCDAITVIMNSEMVYFVLMFFMFFHVYCSFLVIGYVSYPLYPSLFRKVMQRTLDSKICDLNPVPKISLIR